ncbi:MAG: hypothetical protein ABSA40_06535 [Candidatus Dormibacteria bacterium]
MPCVGPRPPELPAVIAATDPARPLFGRAVVTTLLAAAVFTAVTDPTKNLKPIYDHAPWRNDPFDTVYSFAVFFVPLVALLCAARAPLCRRSEPLPIARVQGLLRGCQVAAGAMAITLLTEWAAVAAGANRGAWDGITALLIGSVAVSTALTGLAIHDLVRAGMPRGDGGTDAAPAADWLGDIVAVAERESPRLGPLRTPAVALLRWLDARLLTVVRRHPLVAAALASLVFALGVGGWQAIWEGYGTAAFLLTFGVLGCGVFSFVVAAGSYLGFVRSDRPLRGARRRALDAVVTAGACVVITLAFRASLWWIVGSRDAVAGTHQLAALLALAACAGFVAVLAGESLAGAHARPPR